VLPLPLHESLLQAAEYTAIREELYFLRPLKAKVAGVLFWLAILLWFQVSRHLHLLACEYRSIPCQTCVN
jgi:hypothetical protein